ncbi:MAG: hypothetical protein MUF00_16900 [Gemmatimonadaceae bacterium]|jgi:hypothetical protein|nr:hypothetical protein [Gemmatimonadaceae bacterium]
MIVRLRTLSPLPEQRVHVDRSPFWIGSGPRSALRLWHPGVQDRHVGLLEEADGYTLIPGSGSTLVNGVPLAAERRLAQDDRLDLAPGVTVVVEVETPAMVTGAVAPPLPLAPPPAPARKRRRGLRPQWRVPWRGLLVGGMILSTLAGGGYLVWRAIRVTPAGSLTAAEQLTVDSLLSVSYEHIERGYLLREIGEQDLSRREFDAALALIQRHPLSARDEVRDRLHALARAIDALDPSRQLAGRVRGRRERSLRDVGLGATLSEAEFVAAFAEVREEFEATFPGTPLTVTGRDHPEHLQLYGKGGALDLRVRGLSADQVRFVIDACRRVGIRVKDFSQEAVLQAQVASALRAGRADLAGTGVHLHIDRFGLRRDRWTVGAGAP